MRQPLQRLPLRCGAAAAASDMVDGYDNTAQSPIGGLATQAAAGDGQRGSVRESRPR